MKTHTLLATTLAMLFPASSADAQERWAFELRAGAALPTQDVGSDELGTGMSLEGTLRYRFLPHLGAYAGWDWVRFAPETSFAGDNVDFEETGYAFGLRFEQPFSDTTPISGWVRAGGIYDHLELEDDAGSIIADSGHGFGFEAAAGVALRAGERWSVTPGLRYRSLSPDVEVGDVTTEVDLRYIALELGVALLF